MALGQIARRAQDAQTQAAFLEFAESDTILGAEVARTGAVITLFEIRGRIHRALDDM
jgi:hypothetical protein